MAQLISDIIHIGLIVFCCFHLGYFIGYEKGYQKARDSARLLDKWEREGRPKDI